MRAVTNGVDAISRARDTMRSGLRAERRRDAEGIRQSKAWCLFLRSESKLLHGSYSSDGRRTDVLTTSGRHLDARQGDGTSSVGRGLGASYRKVMESASVGDGVHLRPWVPRPLQVAGSNLNDTGRGLRRQSVWETRQRLEQSPSRVPRSRADSIRSDVPRRERPSIRGVEACGSCVDHGFCCVRSLLPNTARVCVSSVKTASRAKSRRR